MNAIDVILRKRRSAACLAAALLAGLGLAGCARQEAPAATAPVTSAARMDLETAAIRQALHLYVEEYGQATAPEEGVDLAEVSIASDYALVTWVHEEDGGQALLRKQERAWKVIESSPGWLGLRAVCRQGVPDDIAKRLLDGIDPNWSSYETF